MMASADSEGEEGSLPTPQVPSNKALGKRPKILLARAERLDRQPKPILTTLSPPSSAEGVQEPRLHHPKSHGRLRSDSGLALQGSQPAVRQHKTKGPWPSLSSPVEVDLDDDGSEEDFRFCLDHKPSTEFQGFMSQGKVIPDFFAPSWIRMAFSSTETGQRIRRFAEMRRSEADVDFVLKVSSHLFLSHSHDGLRFVDNTAKGRKVHP
jgi:hypothetical protein